MARPLRRDWCSWACTLPSSTLMIVCLVLPQQRSCQGHVETPAHNGTGVALVALAIVGLAPLLWRLPALRPALGAVIGIVLVAALVGTIVGLAALLGFAFVARRIREEQLAALGAVTLAALFVAVFPLAFLFSTMLVGGALAWAAAMLEVVGFVLWFSAAGARPPDPPV
jgi:hypothetical protein